MDVYVLADPRTGRIRYVGLSKDWRRRYIEHRQSHDARRHMPNSRLVGWKRELQEDGGLSPEGFQIGTNLSLAEAQALERKYIMMFRQAGEPILNILDGGGWTNDHIVSEETRARMREAALGRKKSAEVVEKTAAALRGRSKSPEHRMKMCIAQRLRWQQKSMNPETKAKLSTAMKGKPWTAVRRLAQCIPMTAETKAKIADANRGKKGRPVDPETRAKISAAMKAYWEAKRRKDIQ